MGFPIRYLDLHGNHQIFKENESIASLIKILQKVFFNSTPLKNGLVQELFDPETFWRIKF